MGNLTWPIIKDHVDAAVVVNEKEIVQAMKMVYEYMKVSVMTEKHPHMLAVHREFHCPWVQSDQQRSCVVYGRHATCEINVEGMAFVNVDEYHECMLYYPFMQVVVEPSGAVGVAAVMSPQWRCTAALAGCKRVGVILCGGNVDLDAQKLWDSWQL